MNEALSIYNYGTYELVPSVLNEELTCHHCIENTLQAGDEWYTHWGQNKLADNLPAIFSYALYSVRIFVLPLIFEYT